MQTTIGGRWFSHNVVHVVFEACNVVSDISINNNMSPDLGVCSPYPVEFVLFWFYSAPDKYLS